MPSSPHLGDKLQMLALTAPGALAAVEALVDHLIATM